MPYDFSQLKKKIEDTDVWLKKEFNGIRTSRATPAILDGVLVESYGTRLPISQIASITTEDARTLRVVPYDASQVRAIEKAVANANLGLSVVADEKGSRIIFPELTAERRESLLKLVHGKLEQARIALRGERDYIWSDIQKREREGELSKDEKFRYKDEMQELIDEGNTHLEEMAGRKEKEILN